MARQGKTALASTDEVIDPVAVQARTPAFSPVGQQVSRIVQETLGVTGNNEECLRPASDASPIETRRTHATAIYPGDPGWEEEARALFQRASRFALAVFARCDRIFASAKEADIVGDCKDPRSARLGEAKIAKVCMDTSTIALRTYCLALGIALDNLGSNVTNKTTINVNGPAMINGVSGQDPMQSEIQRLLATLPDDERRHWQSALIPDSNSNPANDAMTQLDAAKPKPTTTPDPSAD